MEQVIMQKDVSTEESGKTIPFKWRIWFYIIFSFLFAMFGVYFWPDGDMLDFACLMCISLVISEAFGGELRYRHLLFRAVGFSIIVFLTCALGWCCGALIWSERMIFSDSVTFFSVSHDIRIVVLFGLFMGFILTGMEYLFRWRQNRPKKKHPLVAAMESRD